MKLLVLSTLLISLCTPLSGTSEAQGIALPWKKEHVDALRVFQFLNYIDFGLAEAIETEDSLVLARQYDTLASNLDLAIVRDEQVIRVIESLGRQVDRTETNRLTQQVEQIFSSRLFEAIYRSTTPTVSTEKAILSRVPLMGAPWYDYRRHRPIYTDKMRGKIALTDGQLRELTEIRKDMLRISWELFGKYDVGKSERLTEREMDRFVAVIAEDDPALRARQLKRLLQDQPAFDSFPPFWFYSGMAELEGDGDRGYASTCMDKYGSSYRDIFKKDPLLAMAATARLSLTPKNNRVQRLRNLDQVKSNCAASDWQYYLLAAVVQGEMGIIHQAREDLQRNIDNGHQISLCTRALASILYSARDIRGFGSIMSKAIESPKVKTGDILSMASQCDSPKCKEWLKEEIFRMSLTVAGVEEKCVRLEVPEGWIDFPCSMDVSVQWSDDEPGWTASLPSTALAVLPKGKEDEENRLLETPALEKDPGLPERLTATIEHPLFTIQTGWELNPPEEGMTRDILIGLGRAFPFYRPEAGSYRLIWFSVGNGPIHRYEPEPEARETIQEEPAKEEQTETEEPELPQEEPLSEDKGPSPERGDDPLSEDHIT
ncbi:hypothetical protein [Dethiosulfovibrio salsuginis]|uniref:Uncharacterized protein n=1 Tax=Dethiosulfovibrio salsuginis TaxID=561720 RepID=A0A1X7J8R0_9BACT|nr:hypothetical protein [Dethiosulfovibrio salsuginis]SMG23681.1 hypothetical protein SAMN06275492_10960 [Dethiosulfovibrio salsuginis]